MSKKILRSFKRYELDPYLFFAQNVTAKMLVNPVYAAELPQTTVVQMALDTYQQAANNASGGGSASKQVRDELRIVLNNELDTLARQLELQQQMEESWFIGTGFQLRRKPEKYNGPIPTVNLIYVRRGVQSGTVEGYTDAFPIAVHQVAIEYSADSGQNWHNGTYSTGRRFLLSNLPALQPVQVRVCFQGTRQRMGDWSDPMEVFVL